MRDVLPSMSLHPFLRTYPRPSSHTRTRSSGCSFVSFFFLHLHYTPLPLDKYRRQHCAARFLSLARTTGRAAQAGLTTTDERVGRNDGQQRLKRHKQLVHFHLPPDRRLVKMYVLLVSI